MAPGAYAPIAWTETTQRPPTAEGDNDGDIGTEKVVADGKQALDASRTDVTQAVLLDIVVDTKIGLVR